jgi:four helix bundle suffix protein
MPATTTGVFAPREKSAVFLIPEKISLNKCNKPIVSHVKRTNAGNNGPANGGGTMSQLIESHGGYRNLKSYQMTEIIYDATVVFCDRFIERRSRTHDQMVQAARSGKQNIAEGSMASGTSRKTEFKLVGVARASLEELLLDYEDYMRQQKLTQWPKDHPATKEVRKLAFALNRTYTTYRPYVEESFPETAANTLICLIHQANYLLDQQLRQLEERFLKEGGFTERLYQKRREARQYSYVKKPLNGGRHDEAKNTQG